VTAASPWPLQAVLFDLDGLLVDSEPLWFEAERAVMTRLGGQWSPADQEALLGGSLERTVSYVLAKAAADGGTASASLPPAHVVGRWLLTGMTDLMLTRGLPLRDGARKLLAEVDQAGLSCALVTSSQRQIMQTALAVTGMRFRVTVCREDVTSGKPDPEPYLRAAALLDVDPVGCVVLEDSPNGIAAGRAAGCAVIAVPSVPVPEQPGVPTVASLREVGLGLLRAVATAHRAEASRPQQEAAGASPHICDDG
jgi:HAD superfamily hydrolase (TIGR01509 family)